MLVAVAFTTVGVWCVMLFGADSLLTSSHLSSSCSICCASGSIGSGVTEAVFVDEQGVIVAIRGVAFVDVLFGTNNDDSAAPVPVAAAVVVIFLSPWTLSLLKSRSFFATVASSSSLCFEVGEGTFLRLPQKANKDG